LLGLAGVIARDQLRPFAYLRLRNLYRDTITRLARRRLPMETFFSLAIDSDSVGLNEIDIKQLYGLTGEFS
jgi:hypothetical protein